jgi:N6-adenosine-specific RNA methylase IME4
MLHDALDIMVAWGFTYRSHAVWNKEVAGTGYWFRNIHELLLVGVKGNVPAPAPGTQSASIISARATSHSAKPGRSLAILESYFPTLPKIELFRRGPPRPGWDAWGDEVEAAPPAPAEPDPSIPNFLVRDRQVAAPAEQPSDGRL